MSAVVGPAAAALLVLAMLDASFSGFRATMGRSGLVDHREEDRWGRRAGLVVGVVALLPCALWSLVRVGAAPEAFGRGARAMLLVYGPYAALVLAALVVYRVLSWRLSYLAAALVLGPFTLVRPLVAVGGAVAGACAGGSPDVGVAAGLGAVGVLLVEPVVGRRAVHRLDERRRAGLA